MTIRSVNAAGSVETGIAYHDENGVAQTADATVGYTVLSTAVSASSAGDQVFLTDAVNYGTLGFTTDVDIYVADSVRHTGTEAIDGAHVGTITTNNDAGNYVVGVRVTGRVVGKVGNHVNATTYVDCIAIAPGSVTAFFAVHAINCVAYCKSGGIAFNESNVQNCICINLFGTCAYGFGWCYDVENCMAFGFTNNYQSPTTPVGKNLSSDASAPGSDPYINVAASSVLLSTTNGSADAHWIDKTTAELYIGNDLSGTFIQDLSGQPRSLWSVGSYDYVVTPSILLTPDTGASVSSMFDSTLNQQLVEIPITALIDSGEVDEFLYQSLDKLSLTIDIGDGLKRYLVPRSALRSFNSRNRIYLYRMSDDADNVKAVNIT